LGTCQEKNIIFLKKFYPTYFLPYLTGLLSQIL